MRARIIAGGVVSSIAVLVIGWQLGGQTAVTAPAQQTTTSGSGTTGTSTGTSSSGSTGTGATSGTAGSSGTGTGTTSGSSASGTFAGDTTQTRYGPVQVQITVANGKITDVTALQLTNSDGRSVQISQQAAPILRQEALQAQSAQIQSVSGATFTSEGYTTSLQSAIDKAGL
ncbi:FMN-binding protein [Curtobacterium sp. VKM Ac-2884]|uniref:FMN-binding protein n=1 Tax=Curtobacterium sp. VKM Ac-2884 TaxID=2783818 RepID=UPI00188AE245|nr:FMN-binding protein [Curtobacterium sp. VKM Ac-2884]MBF4604032.1 FMN-binding protein [Curtobacterium sp. VKM Ac-2884]